MSTVWSFDVYDTCVSRTAARPHDLFFLAAWSLLPTHLAPWRRHAIAATVMWARVFAERRAHRLGGVREAVSLDDIYRVLRLPGWTGLSVTTLRERELELEQDCLYAVCPSRARLDDLRAAGQRIVFSSDMYLPPDFIRAQLVRLGLATGTEPLYVSGALGLTKRSGRLFTHLADREGIPLDRITHVGDDAVGDALVPARLGVRIMPFEAGRANRHERAGPLRRAIGDPALTLWHGLSRQARLIGTSGDCPPGLDPTGFLVSVAGPLLTAYVAWVLQEAMAQGVQRLYFVARDGEVLLAVAQILAVRLGGPKLRYLYGSRRAWLAPSADPPDPLWRRLVVTPGQRNSPFDLLARLGLEASQIGVLLAQAGIPSDMASMLSSPWQARITIDSLLADPLIRGVISGHAEAARSTALGYLSQEGLLAEQDWALVDVGWSLNCQAALRRLLVARDPRQAGAVRGFYLGLAKDHLSAHIAGAAFPMLPMPGSLISRRRVVVEHLFTPSTDRTTIGYSEAGGRYEPVLGAESRGPAELAFAARLREGLLAYTRLAVDCEAVWDDPGRFRDWAIGIATRFLSMPTRSEATALAGLSVNADLRHELAFQEPLCRPLDWSDAVSIARTALLGTLANDGLPGWLEASAAMSQTSVRAAVGLMLAADGVRNRIRQAIQFAPRRRGA
jgi:FMN phosphatase YigB (HAD superfamily)